MAGIYIHIPFCKKKCYYCDFFSIASSSRKIEYIESYYYDKKELTTLVALKAGIARSDIKQLMNEKIQDPIESMIDTILGLKRISDSTFIKNLIAVVFDLISKQPAVILGSGINFILPYQTNFRVRVTAPRKILIAYAIKYEGHDTKKAMQIIDKYMKIRKDFVSKFFSKNIAKAHYYDLVINTHFLTVEDAADIVVTAFRKKIKHLHSM